MKTLVITLISALTLTSATASIKGSKKAGSRPAETHTVENRTAVTFETSAYVTKDASIKLAVKKNAPERVYVTLRTANNDVLYRETINKNEMSYAAKINVNELTDGVYKLEIATDKDRVVKRLNLSSSKTESERKITVN
ncbi:MAG: hypothetical protein U0X91_16875 [Spirosomataceae bacterium]